MLGVYKIYILIYADLVLAEKEKSIGWIIALNNDVDIEKKEFLMKKFLM